MFFEVWHVHVVISDSDQHHKSILTTVHWPCYITQVAPVVLKVHRINVVHANLQAEAGRCAGSPHHLGARCGWGRRRDLAEREEAGLAEFAPASLDTRAAQS